MNSKFYLQEKKLSLEVDNKLIQEMVLLSRKWYPNEYGGLLIGYYSNKNQNLIITDILKPKLFKSSPIFFERDTKTLDVELRNFYNSSPSKFYVGEWHSHPNGGTRPSGKDVNAMKDIAESENVAIQNPVLCIIGYTKEDFAIDFHLILNNQIYTYEQQNINL